MSPLRLQQGEGLGRVKRLHLARVSVKRSLVLLVLTRTQGEQSRITGGCNPQRPPLVTQAHILDIPQLSKSPYTRDQENFKSRAFVWRSKWKPSNWFSPAVLHHECTEPRPRRCLDHILLPTFPSNVFLKAGPSLFRHVLQSPSLSPCPKDATKW